MQKAVYLIIGDGRLASHFCHYFQSIEQPFLQWSRRTATSESQLQTYISQVTHVLLLITDSAIDDFIEKNPMIQQKIAIHCSGCLVTSMAIGAHPLMTFSRQLYDSSFYSTIPFVLETEGPDFEILFPRLKNPHVKIFQKDKALYHALCVMGNNFSTILWQKVFSVFEKKFKIPPEYLFPILGKTFENIKDNPLSCLTGPLARDDQETIQKNLVGLSGDSFQKIYEAFISVFQSDV